MFAGNTRASNAERVWFPLGPSINGNIGTGLQLPGLAMDVLCSCSEFSTWHIAYHLEEANSAWKATNCGPCGGTESYDTWSRTVNWYSDENRFTVIVLMIVY